ncbi:MAG: bifunctional oligoribonuclease/PAP phosphatase NrnA [Clostridiales bacterium]|jgi:phosphoesterase RecJ-like protein|nr:bifunctional oligoribonuclease/PAP phosphatase NrnA [Clostridiales bacterium]
MEKLKKIASVLLQKTKIALICHINPDGDTVGSALALYGALRVLGIEADLLSADPIGDKLKYLPFCNRFNTANQVLNEGTPQPYEAAVIIDAGDKSRVGTMSATFDAAEIKICIDHHKTHTLKCDYMYVDPEKAATAEIIYTLIKEFPVDCLTREVATNLFAGILTDSGCFTYPSVTAETHKVAAELYGYGIDAAEIAYHVFKKKTKPAFLLAGKALGNTRFFKNDTIGVVTFFLNDFAETGTGMDETDGIVNTVQSIDTVKAAIAITEADKTHYKVSIRTKEPVDASDIAGEFGGGGHRLAAGCRIAGVYEDVVERLVKAAGDRIV